jgi:predicted DNA-binding antitoxin AbrB/MazE fold protein
LTEGERPLKISDVVKVVRCKKMFNTVLGEIRQGKIELLEHVDLPEGTKVLVTLVPDEESQFWLKASQTSLATVWENPEDDVYGELLEK